MAENILYAFIAIAALGALLGIGLAAAANKLAVKKDERISQVEESLPGANCGACGYAGCAAYAEAIVDQQADITLCTPGGQETAEEIARIMGISIDVETTRKTALVHCWGNDETRTKDFSYRGVEDCSAAYMYFQGSDTCKHGCLALGSCISVCPVDAIYKDSNGRIKVLRDVCIGCEKCVSVCPTGVMKMVPEDADFYVACNSTDKGAQVKKYCSVGCIGCRICEKKFPDAGFYVENNLSYTLYEKSYTEREQAAGACPPKCIRSIP